MKHSFYKILLWAGFTYLIVRSTRAFQKIAWGTGVWYGEYSLKWGILYFSLVAIGVLLVIASAYLLSGRIDTRYLFEKLMIMRERLGLGRWIFVFFIFLLPVYFFQYTVWGVIFNDIYIRILIWLLVIFLLSFLFAKGSIILGWKELLVAILLTSFEFVIAVPFINVTDYPFSMGWSEGNRMWDYSILFGKDLYDYPAGQEIFVLLDIGRQFVGGLPFILPGITIKMERSWIALTVVLPYLMLGVSAFRFVRPNLKIWLLGGAWVLIFLKQGPIHPPLILSAMVVVLLWKRPLWLAIPLIALTGYLTEESRFTWIFAVGGWIAMLEMAGSDLESGKLSRKTWIRSIVLGLTGFLGAQFGQKIAGLLAGISAATPVASVGPAASVEMVVSMVSTPSEPLLWYRLLPNATYGAGIIFGLLIAALPLIILLLYVLISKKWQPNIWQYLVMVGPLAAFLVVGLIVSTKIGGGGDLHNMDMFLITLVFITVIAWNKGASKLWTDFDLSPLWVKSTFLLLLFLPGFHSLADMRSRNFAEEISWLVTLTDSPEQSTFDMYPSSEVSDAALAAIQERVDFAVSNGGEVLFLDQRQLLTFNYITDVPLVPEYEKKVVMNQALSSNAGYFQVFYQELESHRFQLIISEPLRSPIKDSSFGFSEENNAWVKWVSNPVLCYYEPIETFKEVNVQLLIPRTEHLDCSPVLP